VGQVFSAFLRKSVMFRLGILTGLIGILIGCGGGGDGASGFSSVGDGVAGDGDIPTAVDQAPMATISSPIDTFFNEGENIVFSGTGTDAEDGQLTDGALVWISSMDGTIGNGATLITSVLTPGNHEITLSATDSKGASFTTGPVLVHVEPTRFLKMSPKTTGVTDTFNAFDGDYDTAATITTSETEFIHFKAYIGGADTFHFRAKLGASILGSSLSIEGLNIDGNWQPVSDIELDEDKTIIVKVPDAQAFKDADGYINLRALLVNGQAPDAVLIYELWRADPVYAGSQTNGVDKVELAFDGDRSTRANMTTPSNLTVSEDFLYFKAYVGVGPSNTFAFNILMNKIGSGHQLWIYVENRESGSWDFVEALPLDTDKARTVLVGDDEPSLLDKYLDDDGYLNLQAEWIGPTQGPILEIYEIWRIDPFIVGPKTSFGPVVSPESAVDGDFDSFATIYYFWGELGHKDFLHVQTFMGDVSPITFSIAAALWAPSGTELIVDGEVEPDSWSVIKRIILDGKATTPFELPNARAYITADGYLSLRIRWESDSMINDAYIYEIRREEE
jgi:hypothetical protein